MPGLEKVLKADTAGPAFRHFYDKTHYVLAGLVPISALGGENTPLIRLTDLALGVVIPLHAHVGLNGVVSDYVPPRFMGASRWGLLAASSIAFLGLTKLNLSGPGITSTVKSLWHNPEKK
jgi:succinate dehydrogenase (ubiquinone) membrane anchor subunit